MKQVILNIPDNKFNFFIELINSLGLKIEHSDNKTLNDNQKQFVEGINNALEEVEEHLQGKKKLQNAKDFLNEL